MSSVPVLLNVHEVCLQRPHSYIVITYDLGVFIYVFVLNVLVI